MDELKTAFANAQDALAAFKRETRNLVSDAADAIIESRKHDLARLEGAVAQADAALKAHLSTTSSHPWEGKTVTRKVYRGTGWSGAMVDEYGIVEICRIGTEFPSNLSHYSLPKIGSVFVRVLKKDGQAGKRVLSDCLDSQWKLAE